MAKYIVLGLFMTTFMFAVTTMANAEHLPFNDKVDYRDVTCATLAYNAGYDELGLKFANRVQPYYEAQKETVTGFSLEIVDLLAEDALLTEDGTLAESARYFFNQYCHEA